MKKFYTILIACVMLFATIAFGNVEEINDNSAIIHSGISAYDEATLRIATSTVQDQYTLYINSPGGDAWGMIGMINCLEELKAKGVHLRTVNTGWALSAGAWLWMIGDERIAYKGTLFMFHGPLVRDGYGRVIPFELQSPAQQVVTRAAAAFMRQKLLDILHDTELVNELMKKGDNWYGAEKLLELGLVTKLI